MSKSLKSAHILVLVAAFDAERGERAIRLCFTPQVVPIADYAELQISPFLFDPHFFNTFIKYQPVHELELPSLHGTLRRALLAAALARRWEIPIVRELNSDYFGGEPFSDASAFSAIFVRFFYGQAFDADVPRTSHGPLPPDAVPSMSCLATTARTRAFPIAPASPAIAVAAVLSAAIAPDQFEGVDHSSPVFQMLADFFGGKAEAAKAPPPAPVPRPTVMDSLGRRATRAPRRVCSPASISRRAPDPRHRPDREANARGMIRRWGIFALSDRDDTRTVDKDQKNWKIVGISGVGDAPSEGEIPFTIRNRSAKRKNGPAAEQ